MLNTGDKVNPRTLTTIQGAAVALPAADGLVHLQFRRFAGCPICNLHLNAIARRHAEIEAAGVREIVLFHSPAAELAPFAALLPFPLIPDPARRLYAEFAVGSARRSLADPRAWPVLARGSVRTTWRVLRRRERAPAAAQPHGRLGLPADFLIDGTGRVAAVRYGVHAADQWSVDDLLSLAATAG